jgi:small subunit ribosomal protein S16
MPSVAGVVQEVCRPRAEPAEGAAEDAPAEGAETSDQPTAEAEGVSAEEPAEGSTEDAPAEGAEKAEQA